MGKAARRRGTFEERRSQSIRREAARLEAIEAARQRLVRQEALAWASMTPEQEEMSIKRHEDIMRRRHRVRAAFTRVMGMAYGGGFGRL